MSTFEKYTLPLRILHWISGFAVLGMLASGFAMTNFLVPPLKFLIYGKHKAVGVTVGILMLIRVIVRFFSTIPAAQFSKLETVAMRAVHFLLYVVTFGTVFSGYLMSSSGGRVISWFGLFDLPSFFSLSTQAAQAAHNAHKVLVYLLALLVGIHILAALKHLVINKNNIFKRML